VSAPADIYTPWREDHAALSARNVGRTEIGEAIDAAIDSFIGGKSTTHIYLFAPRGLGKSHIIKLAWDRARPRLEEARIPGVLVPEDIPELGSADAILARVASIREGARWQHWRAGARPPAQGPMVIFFEGLDRQLGALHEDERRKLRALLEERGPFLLIATGVSLMDGFTSRETAFFGAFSPWPVQALGDGDAEALLNRLAEGATEAETWPARRQTLVKLAGGSPRTLVALGRACASAPEAWASDQLYAVVQQFTAHYQMRFRDLSPQHQQLVECLAMAPRELSPTEMAAMIGVVSSHASGLARRLVDVGVLLVRSEGRNAWYQLAEPLFRFWMEYRNAPWEQTRVGMLGRLIEAVLTPPDLASMWMENPDQEVQAVVEAILNRSSTQRQRIWAELASKFAEAVATTDIARLEQIVRQGLRSPPPPELLVRMAAGVRPEQRASKRSFGPLLEKQHLEVIQIAWSFEEALAGGEPVREAFAALIQRLHRHSSLLAPPRVAWDHVRDRVVRALITVESRGQPWRLQAEECQLLSQIPVLRAHFLLQGKRATHRPVLAPDDLLLAGLRNAALDLDLLLNAAMQRAHSRLFGTLVHLATTLERPPLPLCAVPGAPAPVGAAPLVAWQARALDTSPYSYVRALSWAASWAALGEEDWSALLSALTKGRANLTDLPLTWRLPEAISVSLTALGRQDLLRLQTLAALVGPGAPLAGIFERALAISAQLAEKATARLHPELAELDRALGSAPTEE